MIARFAAEQTAGLGCPVLYGVEAGHGTENFTIPFGVVARIDSSARRIIFTEPAVSRVNGRFAEDGLLGWSEVEQAFNDAVEQGVIPGATLVVRRGADVAFEGAFGFRSIEPSPIAG